MRNHEESNLCDVCGKGNVVKHLKEIFFRQLSDKGYVHCHAEIPILVCESCGERRLDATAERILDDAFRAEYGKLPQVGGGVRKP